MKKITLIMMCLLLIASGASYGEELGLSAESYILMDELSGRVLIDKNAYSKMPMASTTKIMTSLVALENADINSKVLIGKESTNIEGSSIYLREGEIISLKDLLFGLMLRSGNDAAVAIANYVGKSEENFVKMMNEKAKSIGAVNTNFTNPHGLWNPNHYSTAYDLALITREAFKFDEFASISKSKSYTANRSRENYFVNKNKTLWEFEGGDGGKTGYTIKSGRCLVSTASRNNMRLIAVSLRASDWFNDNYKLLNYGFNNFKHYLIYDKDQFVTKVKIKDGVRDDLAIVTDKDFIYPLKEDEIKKVKIKVNKPHTLMAPISKNQVIGTVETYLDGVLINRDNLIAKYEVRKKSFINRLLDKVISSII